MTSPEQHISVIQSWVGSRRSNDSVSVTTSRACHRAPTNAKLSFFMRWPRVTSRILAMMVVGTLILSRGSVQSQIALTVSQDENGMNVGVQQGAVFTATASTAHPHNYIGVVFDNLFVGNTVQQQLFGDTQIAINGFTTFLFGGSSQPGTDPDYALELSDLFLGFDLPFLPYGPPDEIELSTGNVYLSGAAFNHTAMNANGNAFLVDVNGNMFTDASVTWALVPEPETYAAITGIACIALGILRRHFRLPHSSALADSANSSRG